MAAHVCFGHARTAVFVQLPVAIPSFFAKGRCRACGDKHVWDLCSEDLPFVAQSLFSVFRTRACLLGGNSLPKVIFPSSAQEHAYMVDYARTNRVWGVAEFFPNYAGMRQGCPDDSGETDLKASYERIREGVELPPSKEKLFVSVEHAPTGFVPHTTSGGMSAQPFRGVRNLLFSDRFTKAVFCELMRRRLHG